jgi:hypothetical protein
MTMIWTNSKNLWDAEEGEIGAEVAGEVAVEVAGEVAGEVETWWNP